MEHFSYKMVKKTYAEGCDRENAIHYCFQCGKPFKISEAEYCEKCNWWKAPCGHCGCTLDPISRIEVELAFQKICGGKCKLNPKKRRKSTNIIKNLPKESFLKWVEEFYPDLYTDYMRGRLAWQDLVRQAEIRSGLVFIWTE